MKALLVKLVILAVYSALGGWWLFQKATHLERDAWTLKAQAQKIQAVLTLASAQVEAAKQDSRHAQTTTLANKRSLEDEKTIHALTTQLRLANSRLHVSEQRLGGGSSCPLPKAITSARDSQESRAMAGWRASAAATGSSEVGFKPVEFDLIKKPGPSLNDQYIRLAELATAQALEAEEVNAAYRACRTVLTHEK